MPDNGNWTTVERVNSFGPVGTDIAEDLTLTHHTSSVTEG